jgi:hypothetical protein
MRLKCLIGIAFCAFMVGCNQAAFMKFWTPPEAESTARGYVDLLRQGQFDQIERDLDPSIVDPNLRDTLAKMAAIFPAGNPQSIKVVGVNTDVGVNIFHRKDTSTITLEYQFPNKWLLVSISSEMRRGFSSIVDFHVTPIPDSLENLNKFTLIGKSVVQYSILILAVCSLVFSFYGLILCIRTKDVKKKWLWSIIVLVGVEDVAVNWKTGQLTFGVLSIYLPTAMATRGPYGPWTIGVCIPLGAILFLYRQRKLKIAGGSIAAPVQSAK